MRDDFMKHITFGTLKCPVARALDRIGEWWAILILREAFNGVTRFDQFEKNLSIPPSTLTRRLNSLVEAGLLHKQRYSARPARYEYLLTEVGEDFRPVIWNLISWSSRHFESEGPSLLIVDSKTGEAADPVLVDRRTGRELARPAFMVVPGPAADNRTRERYAEVMARVPFPQIPAMEIEIG
jgi:DNA-binding HxlR family transcriptional regulator